MAARRSGRRKSRFEVRDEFLVDLSTPNKQQALDSFPDGPYLTPRGLEDARKILPEEIRTRLNELARDLVELPDQETYVGDVTAFVVAASEIAVMGRLPRLLEKAAIDVQKHILNITPPTEPIRVRAPRVWVSELLAWARLYIAKLDDPSSGVWSSPEMAKGREVGAAESLIWSAWRAVPRIAERVPQERLAALAAKLAPNLSPRSRPGDIVRRTLSLLGVPAAVTDAALAAERQAMRRARLKAGKSKPPAM